MIAGSDIANGRASSLTERLRCSPSCASSARRVGSASAAKVRSREPALLILYHDGKALSFRAAAVKDLAFVLPRRTAKAPVYRGTPR